MGLINLFKRNHKTINSNNRYSNIYQRQLADVYKNMNYKIAPILPSPSESQKILNNYQTSPSLLVPKEYMEPVNDKLLRGDIVLLWWMTLSKNINKPPLYFIYDYGIDFSNELLRLKSLQLIRSDNRLTRVGRLTLNENNQIIREHKATKAIDINGKITYNFDDSERIKRDSSQKSINGKLSFRSSGDLVNDQSIGRSYERNEDYKNALAAYNSAYRLSLRDPMFVNTPPLNIFQRQVIIYRKLKMYDDELKTCNKALSYYPNNDYFKNRKEKVEIKINKRP